MAKHYDDEPDESALYNAEVEARRAQNKRDAIAEHASICWRYADALRQRNYMEKTVDMRDLPAKAEQWFNQAMADLQERKTNWKLDNDRYHLDVMWPF